MFCVFRKQKLIVREVFFAKVTLSVTFSLLYIQSDFDKIWHEDRLNPEEGQDRTNPRAAAGITFIIQSISK